MKQYLFYKQYKINPIKIELNSKSGINSYFNVKKNLYQNLLMIPCKFFFKKKIFDIGCGSGESTLFFAKNGGLVTTLEANQNNKFFQNKLFNFFKIKKNIESQLFMPFQKYKNKKKFDFISAEGWLHTDNKKEQLLRSMSKILSENGIIVISFYDRYGSFFEIIKKTAMWKLLQIYNVNKIFSDKSINLSKKLFGLGFKKIPNRRKIETWISDSLLSPFLTWKYLWSTEEIIFYAKKLNLKYYSSTPSLYEPPYISWYKKITNEQKIIYKLRSNYTYRKFDFMFGKQLNLKYQEKKLNDLSNDIDKILISLSKYTLNINNEPPIIFFKKTKNKFKELGYSDPILDELEAFFEILKNEKRPKNFIRKYIDLSIISNTWGNLNHYLALTKSNQN